MGRRKPEFRSRLILKMFDLFGHELDHEAAARADHMVVMRVIVMVLEVGLVVAEPDLASKARLSQQPQSTINRRVSNGRVLFLNKAMKILDREMFFSAKKGLHYQLTLIGSTQAGGLNIFEKDRPLVRKFVFALRHRSTF